MREINLLVFNMRNKILSVLIKVYNIAYWARSVTR